MKPLHFFTIAVFSFFLFTSAYAWDGHSIMTYIALKDITTLNNPTIPAETLDAFLQKEKTGISKLLNENEAWSKQHIYHYQPLPASLVFNDNDEKKPLKMQFIKAIRTNPDLQFPIFIQYVANVPHRIQGKPLTRADVMILEAAKSTWVYTPNSPLEAILPNTNLTPLEILTTAADEPDYGMDTSLWEDNHSSVSLLYQWGNQPFGNKNFILGTQAPFHMGFFYESTLLYTLAPGLKISFIEYRIHLYLALSRYAFKTGHPYWGYRFLGWGLHYIQDLTQPYHSTATPNISTAKLISTKAQTLFSDQAEKNLIQLLSNKHFSLENYSYYFLENHVDAQAMKNPVIHALIDTQHDHDYPNYTDSYPREIVAKESHETADLTDQIIRDTIPEKYIDDPSYIFYTTEPHVNLFETLTHDATAKPASLDTQLAVLMRNLGSHTRNVIRYILSGL